MLHLVHLIYVEMFFEADIYSGHAASIFEIWLLSDWWRQLFTKLSLVVAQGQEYGAMLKIF